MRAARLTRRDTVAAAVLSLAACARPIESAGSRPSRLFVANAGDGTVAAIDLPGGSRSMATQQAGVPDQLAPGPDGSVLATVLGDERRARLIQLMPVGALGTGWRQRPIPLDATGGGVRDVLLASDGVRWAAVAARSAGPASRCVVSVVDAVAGRVTHELAVGEPGEFMCSLAVAPLNESPLVYVGLERPGGAVSARDGGGRGRIAIVATEGDVVRSIPLAGAPAMLELGAWGWDAHPKLYCVESHLGDGSDPAEPRRAGLLVLDADTLVPEAHHEVDANATHLSLAPRGDAVYLLVQDTVVEVSIPTGTSRSVTRLPERGLALVAAAERIYVAGAYGNDVWSVDRRTGHMIGSTSTGRAPVALALAR